MLVKLKNAKHIACDSFAFLCLGHHFGALGQLDAKGCGSIFMMTTCVPAQSAPCMVHSVWLAGCSRKRLKNECSACPLDMFGRFVELGVAYSICCRGCCYFGTHHQRSWAMSVVGFSNPKIIQSVCGRIPLLSRFSWVEKRTLVEYLTNC